MADVNLAAPADEAAIKQLLSEASLPHSDLTPQHLTHFIVARSRSEQRIIGTVG